MENKNNNELVYRLVSYSDIYNFEGIISECDFAIPFSFCEYCVFDLYKTINKFCIEIINSPAKNIVTFLFEKIYKLEETYRRIGEGEINDNDIYNTTMFEALLCEKILETYTWEELTTYTLQKWNKDLIECAIWLKSNFVDKNLNCGIDEISLYTHLVLPSFNEQNKLSQNNTKNVRNKIFAKIYNSFVKIALHGNTFGWYEQFNELLYFSIKWAEKNIKDLRDTFYFEIKKNIDSFIYLKNKYAGAWLEFNKQNNRLKQFEYDKKISDLYLLQKVYLFWSWTEEFIGLFGSIDELLNCIISIQNSLNKRSEDFFTEDFFGELE